MEIYLTGHFSLFDFSFLIEKGVNVIGDYLSYVYVLPIIIYYSLRAISVV